jgi:hypothetical protein
MKFPLDYRYCLYCGSALITSDRGFKYCNNSDCEAIPIEFYKIDIARIIDKQNYRITELENKVREMGE